MLVKVGMNIGVVVVLGFLCVSVVWWVMVS